MSISPKTNEKLFCRVCGFQGEYPPWGEDDHIHNKKAITDLLKRHGHALLPLPPYSPDLNPIEQSFGILKRRRQFLPIETPLDALFVPKC